MDRPPATRLTLNSSGCPVQAPATLTAAPRVSVPIHSREPNLQSAISCRIGCFVAASICANLHQAGNREIFPHPPLKIVLWIGRAIQELFLRRNNMP